ncbi:MAG: peptide chain release factor N(5)-glutamine methyltransferase [Spirochaetes bacterium]|nr:peptide chain release factor N(5)-glutamine methyltransferase [Spirochaetota bacterium]
MNIRSVLRTGYSTLSGAKADTPMLDAVVLLAEAAGLTKEKLIASFPGEIDEKSYSRFKHFLDLRCSGQPVSYILNRKEFYGLEFYVDSRVLVPRPDTETLVEAVLEMVACDDSLTDVLDICTGSGCVAITLKYINKDLKVSASDISGDALKVFKKNCINILGYTLPVYESDLFSGITEKYDIIAGNPPYLFDDEVHKLKKLNWPEPELALSGGKNGTGIANRIIRDAVHYLNTGGYLIMEAAEPQMAELYGLMDLNGYDNIRIRNDLAGRKRVICGRVKKGGRYPADRQETAGK